MNNETRRSMRTLASICVAALEFHYGKDHFVLATPSGELRTREKLTRMDLANIVDLVQQMCDDRSSKLLTFQASDSSDDVERPLSPLATSSLHPPPLHLTGGGGQTSDHGWNET